MKPFWQSKTFWINALAALALVAQGQLGQVLDPELAALALAVANIGLRFLAHSTVTIG